MPELVAHERAHTRAELTIPLVARLFLSAHRVSRQRSSHQHSRRTCRIHRTPRICPSTPSRRPVRRYVHMSSSSASSSDAHADTSFALFLVVSIRRWRSTNVWSSLSLKTHRTSSSLVSLPLLPRVLSPPSSSRPPSSWRWSPCLLFKPTPWSSSLLSTTHTRPRSSEKIALRASSSRSPRTRETT